MVFDRIFGPSKIMVFDRNFGRFKSTVVKGNFGPSKTTIVDRYFGPSKITVVDRNFKPFLFFSSVQMTGNSETKNKFSHFFYITKYLLQQHCRTTRSCWHKALLSSIEGGFQSKKTLDRPTGLIVAASGMQGCTL